VKITLYQTQRW